MITRVQHVLLLLLCIASCISCSNSGGESKRFVVHNIPKSEWRTEKLVVNEFLSRNWTRVPFGTKDCDFIWTKFFSAPNPNQLHNFFVGTNTIKLRYKHIMAQYWKKLDKEHPELGVHDFIPRAYITSARLDRDYRDFVADFSRAAHGHLVNDSEVGTATMALPPQRIDGSSNLWLVKPSLSSGGRGISIISNLTELAKDLANRTNLVIIQKYIENPFLYDGRKFDLRGHMLVTSLNPLVVFFHDKWFGKVCAKPYDAHDLSTVGHVTNMAHQLHHENFNTEDWMMSLSKLKDAIIAKGYPADYWERVIQRKIEKIGLLGIKNWSPMDHRDNSFAIIGLDVMLDEDLNPYLLEINAGAVGLLVLDHKDLDDVYRPLVHDIFSVVLDHRDLWQNNTTYPRTDERFGGFKLLYHGGNKSNTKPKDEL